MHWASESPEWQNKITCFSLLDLCLMTQEFLSQDPFACGFHQWLIERCHVAEKESFENTQICE